MIQDTIYFFRCKWLQRLSFDLFSDALVAKSIFQFIVRCYGFGDYISILISCAIGLQRQSVFLIFRCYGCGDHFQVLWLQKLSFSLFSVAMVVQQKLSVFLFPGAMAAETIFYSSFQVLRLQKLSFILISRCYGCGGNTGVQCLTSHESNTEQGTKVSNLTRVTLSRAPW